jgi:hypothetical protein
MNEEPAVPYSVLVDEKFGRVWDKFKSVEEAIGKADTDLTAYKLTANEFRGTLSDQAARLATKEELGRIRDTIEIQRQRIDTNEKMAANTQGKIWALAAVFAVLQVLINLAQRFLPHIP